MATSRSSPGFLPPPSLSLQGAYEQAVGHYTVGLEAGCEVLSDSKLSVIYGNR